jgi:hypothetical protein
MRKIPLLITALVFPAVPLLIAGPAHAAANVICVGNPVGPCGSTVASIPAALIVANGNLLDDTILVGPGTYSDGPYSLNGGTHALTLKGSGVGTKLTLPASATGQSYVVADHATVRDLGIKLNTSMPDNDIGISASDGSTIANVTVDGTGVLNARGLAVSTTQITGSTVQMPGAGSVGIYGNGAVTVSDSTVTADNGFSHSGPNSTETLSRLTFHVGAGYGVALDSGTVDIDDSVIDLGTGGGVGIQAANFNNSTDARVVHANHLTIVGGGANSRGVWSYAAAAGAKQTSVITMASSIVWGPSTSLVAQASNGGSVGGASSATVAVSHTDYQTVTNTIGANGAGGVSLGAGNLVNVDPAFVNAGAKDYHLSLGSAAIDAGDQAGGTPLTDRDGNARVQDGNANGVAVRDLGAYEYPDVVAPQTKITGGPAARTRDTTPTITFTSDPGATFQCQVDAAAFKPCTSPFTTTALTNAAHVLRVRATDASANTDATPATRSVTVDTKAPNTGFTKKPAKKIRAKSVRFKFVSSEAGSSFTCRLDKQAWKRCASPRAFKVAKGAHVFSVRATDAAGNVDKTPAVFRFRRK